MRKITQIIIVLLLIANPWFILAQEEAEPLLLKLGKAQGTEKVDVLNELSAIYRKTDRLKSLDFAENAYSLSVKNNYIPGKALALKNQGICRFFMGNNDSALICYNQALAFYTSLNDEEGKSACYNNLGLVSQETGKYDEALDFYQQAIDLDKKRGNEIGIALTYDNIADIYMYLGNPNKALDFTNKSLSIYSTKSYKPGLMSAYNNRASEYNYLGKYEQAIKDYKVVVSVAREINDKYYEILALSNMGVVIWHMGRPDSALVLLNKALEMSDEADDGYNILNSLGIEAEIFTSLRQFDKSNDILQRILKRYEEMGNIRQVATVLTSLGRNLMQTNELDKAIGYFSKSLEITQSIDAKYEMLENYRNLAHAQAIVHNFAAADSLQDLFADIYSGLLQNDSVSKDNLPVDATGSNEIVNNEPLSNWITAFLLFIFIIMLSVISYHQKK